MTSDAGFGTVSPRKQRYKDGELLHEMYIGQKRSMADIADELDCATNTIRKYLIENDIEIRSIAEASPLGRGYNLNEVPYQTHVTGAEVWQHSHMGDRDMVYVHRLLAVAEFGFDAVCDKVVHHVNHIRWDNRHKNLELMAHGEHSSHHHRKVDEETRQEIAERYEYTDDSSYTIAEDYRICANTVRDIHDKRFGNQEAMPDV